MRRTARGFTLIELMIVIAIVAVIASIAVPNLLAARLAANETAAIASLRNLVTAQAQFQQSARLDVDGDGQGEYGSFTELSGGAAGRMAGPLIPPLLGGSFRLLTNDAASLGYVSKGGYLFRIYLPAAAGAGTSEDETGAFAVAAESHLSEAVWCAYAWPMNYGRTGRRTFFANQGTDVLTTELDLYSGPDAGPPADAAFLADDDITSRPDIGGPGQQAAAVWRQVG